MYETINLNCIKTWRYEFSAIQLMSMRENIYLLEHREILIFHMFLVGVESDYFTKGLFMMWDKKENNPNAQQSGIG